MEALKDPTVLGILTKPAYQGMRRVPYPRVVKGANAELQGFLIPERISLADRAAVIRVLERERKRIFRKRRSEMK